MIHRGAQIVLVLSLFFTVSLRAQNVSPASGGVLHGVKAFQVESNIVLDPSNVNDASAANLVQDRLKKAFRLADFEVADSARVRAHLVLDEFSSGNTAKRVLIGFGAGRSNVTCRLVLQDANRKELSNARIHVRGNLIWSPYQGNNTQRKQGVSSFDQRLVEEIEKMK
jgi:hypothetical protein